MRLVTESDPLETWIYAERYLGVGTRGYSQHAHYSEMPPPYQPSSDTRSFMMPTYLLREGDLKLVSGAADWLPSRDHAVLPVHPATVARLDSRIRRFLNDCPSGPSLEVSPTASSRTVYVRSSPAELGLQGHFLKLHFPGRISRFARHLQQSDVRHQLWTSRQLRGSEISHLPDLWGGYGLHEEDQSVGFIVRKARPTGDLGEGSLIIPGFALYGQDLMDLSAPPLLCQLVALFEEPAEFFLVERLVKPTIRLWGQMVQLGLVPETHGQNTLLCVDIKRKLTSVCLRDMDVFASRKLRQARQLDCTAHDAAFLEDNLEYPVTDILSLSYDSMLVHHFLQPLCACAETLLGIDRKAIRRAAKETFEQIGLANYFGDTVRYYGDQIQAGESFILKSVAHFEAWR